MHLLVIEDERALCETIVRSLRRLAYSVDYCYDGEKALELLGVECYDLVLLDLNLPKKDGMTVLRALREIHERADAVRRERFQEMAADGEKYLEENREREGVNSTESGLQFRVLTQGEGAIPARTDRVRVHYTGKLIDGTVFDSSVARGEPAEFPVTGVIGGWIEALTLMPVGSKWELTIPHNLAYGERGAGASIPPFSTLVFEVELLEIL